MKPELQRMPIPGKVFGRLHVGIVGPITASQDDFKYVLVFVDAFSRWIEVIPIKECSAKTIAWHLYDSIITRYGAPDELLSDRGQNFLSNVVKELCSVFQPPHDKCRHRENASIHRSINQSLVSRQPFPMASVTSRSRSSAEDVTSNPVYFLLAIFPAL
jgi:hypothetical protein